MGNDGDECDGGGGMGINVEFFDEVFVVVSDDDDVSESPLFPRLLPRFFVSWVLLGGELVGADVDVEGNELEVLVN